MLVILVTTKSRVSCINLFLVVKKFNLANGIKGNPNYE